MPAAACSPENGSDGVMEQPPLAAVRAVRLNYSQSRRPRTGSDKELKGDATAWKNPRRGLLGGEAVLLQPQ